MAKEQPALSWFVPALRFLQWAQCCSDNKRCVNSQDSSPGWNGKFWFAVVSHVSHQIGGFLTQCHCWNIWSEISHWASTRWDNVDSYSTDGSIIVIEKCQEKTNHALNPCEACITWSDILRINTASDSAHLPVTPCSCESSRYNQRTPWERSSPPHPVYTVAALTWLNSLHPDSERSLWALPQHQDILHNTERHGKAWRRREWQDEAVERGHFEKLDASTCQTASLVLSHFLIPSLIHQHSGQSFEAGHNPWSLGPKPSPRPIRTPPQTAPAGCQQRSGRLRLLQRDS